LLPQAARVNAARQSESSVNPGIQTAPVLCGSDRPPTPRGPKRVLILETPARVGAEGHQPQHHNLVRALERQRCHEEQPPANVRGIVKLPPP